MTSKEKAENFDDLDTLDEEQWGEDADPAAGLEAVDAPAQKGSARSGKKSSGGFFFGLILLALMGGGSWYAYQNDLIPGVKKGDFGLAKAPEAPSPDPSADVSLSEPAQVADSQPLESAELPPMPDSEDSGTITDSSQELTAEAQADPLQTGETASAPDSKAGPSDDVLTPFPVDDASGSGADLQPLELADSEAQDVPAVAEKDGMLLQDASSQLLDPEAKLADSSSEAQSELSPEVVAPSADTPEEPAPLDAESLDELTLSDQVDQTPTPAETPSVEALSDLSGKESKPEVDATAADDLDTSLPADSAPAELDSGSEPPVSAPEEAGSDLDLGLTEKTEAASPSVPVSSDAPAEKKDLTEQAAPSTQSPPPPEPDSAVKVPETEASPAAAQDKEDKVPPAAEAVEAKVEKKPDTASAPASPPKKVMPSPTWKLKSAQPGSAVLYDSRTGDVKTVEVGDRVSGIGKVKSISQVNGKWVVKGTSGKVSQ